MTNQLDIPDCNKIREMRKAYEAEQNVINLQKQKKIIEDAFKTIQPQQTKVELQLSEPLVLELLSQLREKGYNVSQSHHSNSTSEMSVWKVVIDLDYKHKYTPYVCGLRDPYPYIDSLLWI